MEFLKNISIEMRKSVAVLEMKKLDSLAKTYSLSREDSLLGTIKWLMLDQDSTKDDDVSYGYSLYGGWTVSYPETTEYIIQKFL